MQRRRKARKASRRVHPVWRNRTALRVLIFCLSVFFSVEGRSRPCRRCLNIPQQQSRRSDGCHMSASSMKELKKVMEKARENRNVALVDARVWKERRRVRIVSLPINKNKIAPPLQHLTQAACAERDTHIHTYISPSFPPVPPSCLEDDATAQRLLHCRDARNATLHHMYALQ